MRWDRIVIIVAAVASLSGAFTYGAFRLYRALNTQDVVVAALPAQVVSTPVVTTPVMTTPVIPILLTVDIKPIEKDVSTVPIVADNKQTNAVKVEVASESSQPTHSDKISENTTVPESSVVTSRLVTNIETVQLPKENDNHANVVVQDTSDGTIISRPITMKDSVAITIEPPKNAEGCNVVFHSIAKK